MRMILVLVALVIVALLVANQLREPIPEAVSVSDPQGAQTPDVPTRPQDVQGFEEDINAFTLDSAEMRAQRLEEME